MKKYLYLLITILSAFFIILIIYRFGDIPNRRNNGFVRHYLLNSYSKMHEIDLRDTLYGIVGATRSTIYITTPVQDEILAVGSNGEKEVRRIKIPYFSRFYDSLKFNSLAINIDSPYIYLFAENKPAIIKTAMDSSIFEIRILPPGPFTREVMIGRDRFILRKLESGLTDQIFVRYDLNSGILKKETGISEINGDGGIVSDGRLHFDSETRKLYYVYYYKNQILSFDTSLNLSNRFSLIDTTSSFKIRTGLVKNSGSSAYTNITPAYIINKANYVEKGLLYNMSALRADNETDKFFSDNSILDIIDLKNGRYRGSICLPASHGSKLSQFFISNNRLISLYTNSIIIYDLDPAIDRQDQ
ncbi:MAG TPA: hypothetical protein VL727_06565 [Puia sp.]|jgi:hypothetical protein|nr:hypothetical protein [Puia sp.]